MSYLAPYLPTIVLALLGAFFIVADLIKGKNVIKEDRKQKKQEIIDAYEEKNSILEELKSMHDRFDSLEKKIDGLGDRISKAEARLDDLTKSDMHDIKGWIVDQYQRFYIDQGWIDAFHAEIIDKRYEDYKKEGGNSYIETLIERLHSLPMDPPEKKHQKK